METFKNEEVTINGKVKLAGTLTIPEGKEQILYPAILIIPGTGTLNRDGNMKGLQLNIWIKRTKRGRIHSSSKKTL